MISALVLTMNDSFFLPYSLEASRGFFERYVIYNSGSTDNTNEIIKWFIDSCKGMDISFYVRDMPQLPPSVQGCFRNSMIAEAGSDYYCILDSDEIYNSQSFSNLLKAEQTLENNQKLYGIVRRIEVNDNLKEAYGVEKFIPHHRLYHRKAVWCGSHPGEFPLVPQNNETQIVIPDITCWHFHNCSRSPKDKDVPKRIERRFRPTYRPGNLSNIDIFKELPILKKPIENFPVNPELKKLQDSLK